MTPDYISVDEKLLIPGLSKTGKIIYVLSLFLPLFLLSILVIFFNLALIYALIILVFLGITYRQFVFYSYNFRTTIISKTPDGILINNKKILFEDFLFLSLREKDFYKIIRFEAKRNNILVANEKILKTNCKNYEHALLVCKGIRDYIHPSLKINNIKVGYVPSRFGSKNAKGRRDESKEIWEFIEENE